MTAHTIRVHRLIMQPMIANGLVVAFRTPGHRDRPRYLVRPTE